MNTNGTVKFFSGEQIPLEMHEVRMVQRINLLPVREKLAEEFERNMPSGL